MTVTADTVRVFHSAKEVAMHQASEGRRQRVEDPAHFEGLVGGGKRPPRHDHAAIAMQAVRVPVLLRSLTEYEALVGGGF